MEPLGERVRKAIAEARKGHPQSLDRMANSGDAVVAFSVWLKGIENALREIALEVEKLAATVEHKTSGNDD